MNKYSIGEVAKIVKLPAKTIRFYEDQGVIGKPERLDNGYRAYPETIIEELKLLSYARDLGLPLNEIKKLIKGCDGGNCQHSRGYVEKSIENYLKILNEKIVQMESLRTKLKDLKTTLDNGDDCTQNGPYCCNILHQLLVSKEGGE